MRTPPTILQTCHDPSLFAPWFKDHSTWAAWFAVLAGLFALAMDTEQRNTFCKLTGRSKPLTKPASEAWFIVGRRGGKSFIVSLIAVYLACFRDYSAHLSPGERGTVMIVAQDRKQARVILRYIAALLDNVAVLAPLVEKRTAESLDLSNGVSIEVHTCSFRATRGYTVVAALLDETGYWRTDESANPDTEVVEAIRPAMATIPDAVLIGIGSPYRRRGILFEAHRDHFGRDDSDVLVVRADSRTMNPSLRESVIARAYERDPQAAAAEYGAEFRSDLQGFLDEDWLSRAIDLDRPPELPPRADLNYLAFVDPSGGRGDAFTLGICHAEGDDVVLDLIRGRKPPFDPSAVVADYAQILRSYGCMTCVGDHYSGEWVVSAFREHGISYEPSSKAKSEIYIEAGPLFATGRARLPDHRVLLAELRHLERRAGRQGRDLIDHPPGGHDDHANAACGALWLVAGQERPMTAEEFAAGCEFYSSSVFDSGYLLADPRVAPWLPAELMRWVWAEGRKLNGLVRRRTEEAKYYAGTLIPERWPRSLLHHFDVRMNGHEVRAMK